MKFKGIDIDKAVVSQYSDEQLAEFAAGNGLSEADAADLKGKLAPADVKNDSTLSLGPIGNGNATTNVDPGPGAAAIDSQATVGKGKTAK